MAVTNPFSELIQGVLQGHQIATQLRNQSMHEEAFQRQKESQDRESQLQDIQAQMQLSAAGRPVTGNMVEQSFDAPSPDNGVPGVDRSSQTVKFSRPADKNRLLTYKTKDGRTIQSEAYTPQETFERQTSQAMQQKRGGAIFDAQTGDMMRDYELATHGVPLPDDIAEANGYPKGSKVLPGELTKLAENASTVRKNNRVDVAPGASVVDLTPDRRSAFGGNAPMVGAKPDAGPVQVNLDGSTGEPAASPNPLVAAAQKTKDGATAAGNQARVLFQAPEKPDKPTGDFEKIFLPAFALKHGKTLDNLGPDLTMQAVNEYAQRSKDPETLRLAHALTQAHLDQLNASRSTTPMKIDPGTREYKVAQDLAYGKLTFPQFRSLFGGRTQEATNKKLDLYDKAGELNPNFNPAAFEMGFTLAKNPKVQQQLAALDNVVTAVPDLMKFSDAATRAGATVLNKFIVPGGVAVGSKKYSNFKTAQIAFADELSGALGFGSATDMSKEMGFNMSDPNLSPDNFRAAVQDVVVPFIERKRGTMLKQMGIYGTPEMNPAAPPKATETTPAVKPPLSSFEKK